MAPLRVVAVGTLLDGDVGADIRRRERDAHDRHREERGQRDSRRRSISGSKKRRPISVLSRLTTSALRAPASPELRKQPARPRHVVGGGRPEGLSELGLRRT